MSPASKSGRHVWVMAMNSAKKQRFEVHRERRRIGTLSSDH
jgi:hypothetical protein